MAPRNKSPLSVIACLSGNFEFVENWFKLWFQEEEEDDELWLVMVWRLLENL